MIDRISKLDDSLMDAYKSIHELHKGHASGDSDIDKQASQLASDIRYKAKGKMKEGTNPDDRKRIYLSLLSQSSAPSVVKSKAKKKLLGLSEEIVVEKLYSGKGVGRRENTKKNPIGLDQSDPSAGQKARKTVKKVASWAKDDIKKDVDRVKSVAKKASPTVKKVVKGAARTVGRVARAVSDKSPITKDGIRVPSAVGKVIDHVKKGFSEDATNPEKFDLAKFKQGLRDREGAVFAGDPVKKPSEKSQRKATRKRAASDEKERRFKKRNPAVTSGRYPKDDEKAWDAAREREKREGIGEDTKYGYDKEGNSLNPKDIKKRKKVSEGKLVHGPFGPYITGQKLPREHKETPLVKVPYENINLNKKVSVGEAAPAVEKVIESIKINKTTPKSPNCIIMPKKDDIADKADGNGKKSTKEVVSKKHKQFFNQEGNVAKTYNQFLNEYLQTLTKVAAKQAAKGAITTTAKTVGKETVKQTAKKTGGAIVKSTGGQVAKQTGGAIVKSTGGKVVKSTGGQLAKKGGKLVKAVGKETAIQTATQTAIDKVSNNKPTTTTTAEKPKDNTKTYWKPPTIKLGGLTTHVKQTKNPQ